MTTDEAVCRRQVSGDAFDACHVARLSFEPRYFAAVAIVLASTLAPPLASQLGAVIEAPAVVALQPRPFSYRLAGEFTRDGRPLSAPLRIAQLDRTLTIMIHQVTVADYERCVRDRGCLRIPHDSSDQPVVKVNWQDATAYAAWLSRQLGAAYRLPTDEEWAFAAGSRFSVDEIPDVGRDVEPAVDGAQVGFGVFHHRFEIAGVLEGVAHAFGVFFKLGSVKGP